MAKDMSKTEVLVLEVGPEAERLTLQTGSAMLVQGPKGDTGLSAWAYAVSRGYTGTEADFAALQASLPQKADAAAASAAAAETAQGLAEAAQSAAASSAAAAETHRNNAAASATASASSASAASSSASAASSAKSGAESARDAAVAAKNAAESARAAADTAKTAAQGAQTAAEAAKNAAQTAAGNAEGSADEAEAWATGTINGAAVSSAHPAYQNNAKWYKDQAAAIVGGDYPTKAEAQSYATTAKAEAITTAAADATAKASAALGSANTYTDQQIAAIPPVDISGKVDKVVPSSAYNVATLDATGNLGDSGWKIDVYATNNTVVKRTAAGRIIANDPTGDTDVTTRQYVAANFAAKADVQGKVDKTGDTMTGPLVISTPPSYEGPNVIAKIEGDRIVFDNPADISVDTGLGWLGGVSLSTGSASLTSEINDIYNGYHSSSVSLDSQSISLNLENDGHWGNVSCRFDNGIDSFATLTIDDVTYKLYGEHNPPPIPDGVATEEYVDSEIATISFAFTGTLTTGNWTGSAAPYTQAVTVTGISGTGKKPIVDIMLSEDWATAIAEDEQWFHIKRVSYANNTLTFYADEVPSVALNFGGVQVK